ncbi:hypothetical protein UCRNP2_7326 [Neofusicoccum parvum UCRNP2]|uniref:Uncharacterized protein n=1 Tax=Botryosphaeria parva (strain UCR-NP2) TaxID=1287680 RepID=R1GJ18_BOTPV|nr:hypothetical protein UCRNP2_7326 [Neofusicoccum parvum UCRNP2]
MPGVRSWSRRQRADLLKGPKATVELDAGEGKPRTVISVPRAALMAFSTVAADLLQDEQYKNLLLPQGMAAPAALRYVIEWIPRACDSADFMPIKRKEDFKHNVRICQAALSLGVTEALTTVGGWMNLRISDFEKRPWSWDHTLDTLLVLPKDCALIDRLVEKVARARRREILTPEFGARLQAFLDNCPELGQRFRLEDNPLMKQQQELQRCRSDSTTFSGRSSSNNGSSDGVGLDRAPKRSRGGCRNRCGRSSNSNSPTAFNYDNGRVLTDADVDFLMGRL